MRRELRTQFADYQRHELEILSRQAVGWIALRGHMVLLSGQECQVAEIAHIHCCGRDVVRHWLHRYDELGMAGLYDGRASTSCGGKLSCSISSSLWAA